MFSNLFSVTAEEFRKAARDGDNKKVLRYIKQRSANELPAVLDALAITDNSYSPNRDIELYKNSALLLAVTYGQVEVVNTLLANGADVNGPSRSGDFPITACCQADLPTDIRMQIFQSLINHGANTSLKNSQGETALFIAKKFDEQTLIDLLEPPEFRPQTDEEKKAEAEFRARCNALGDAAFDDDFICPITHELIFDPVYPKYYMGEKKGVAEEKLTAIGNHAYERQELISWLLTTTNQSDPINRRIIIGLVKAPELTDEIMKAIAKFEAASPKNELAEDGAEVKLHVREATAPVPGSTQTTANLFQSSQSSADATTAEPQSKSSIGLRPGNARED